MSDNAIACVIGLGLVLAAALLFGASFLSGTEAGRREMKQEAVKAGPNQSANLLW